MLDRQVTTGGDRARSDASGDAQLIGRIAQKDLRAFEELYRAYHPRLSRFVMRLVRRSHIVEEVLNDTMLVVWNQPQRYNGACKVSTWIFAIAYRKALKARRRQDDPVEDKLAESRASAEAGPEQQLGRRQVHEVLASAIDKLSVDQRAVVDLTYFHEIGYREIAEIMGCPVDTVKTRM
ncbi:MAG TPA: sigma-70 family RNA polymerase sigma factor, partial [Caulobacteraceae bacterium]|nr:sigma-70 family RNA polymerase sigma factor [Caulobacteraceae bacterium]